MAKKVLVESNKTMGSHILSASKYAATANFIAASVWGLIMYFADAPKIVDMPGAIQAYIVGLLAFVLNLVMVLVTKKIN